MRNGRRKGRRAWSRTLAAVVAGTLLLAACGTGGDDTAGEPSNGEQVVATGVGVTDEPCEQSVNPDNGCIYLGVLSDLTQGPFAALATETVRAMEAFWARVNEAGGIGGYDIDVVTYVRDNHYNPQQHQSQYLDIEPSVVALAQSLGTVTTLAALEEMDQDDMVAVPASWWSGWGFEDVDRGLILEVGYSNCMESMIGLDWLSEQEGAPSRVMAVGYPGDYGGDGAAGVEIWAEANDVEFVGFTETSPNQIAGDQDGAVQAILQGGADIVQLGVGPAEAGEIVGKAVARGFEGMFLGSIATWHPSLAQSEVMPAMEARYINMNPWGPWGSDSDAHRAMEEALGDDLPANEGYTFGWIWQYPMKALLERAVENGDLTRPGLRQAIDGLEVDFEGALGVQRYGDDPNAALSRTAVISVPDGDEVTGLRQVEYDVTGPTGDAHEYTEPCTDVR